MKAFATLAALAGLFASTAVSADPPKMPAPTKEHEWLLKFAGTWEGQGECYFDPNKPMKLQGTETAKAVGGFWLQSDIKGEFAGQPMAGCMTLGYDPNKKKFVGTWIDSMSSHMFKYEGTVDSTGNVLTLEGEGPSPLDPSKMAKFKDVTEFKGADQKVMSSFVQGPDGKWIPMMKMESKKK